MENSSSTSKRKSDHIELAFESALRKADSRFSYEPMLSAHPSDEVKPFSFLGKQMFAPIWVSSMTGGTEKAGLINRNLARVCGEFGLGMGLGSCRIILEDDAYFEDFNMRPIIGENAPLFANLGIAQIETLLNDDRSQLISQLVAKLQADGLIVHVNPMQEWLQPEGDRLLESPINTIKHLLQEANYPVIVKEVGQGFGRESMKELLSLPIAALDFGAFGGTNFAKLELLREQGARKDIYEPLSHIGHTHHDMVNTYNDLVSDQFDPVCKEVIISGGVNNFLDGYYLVNKIHSKAVYGMAAGFLRHATGSYEELKEFTRLQIQGYRLAEAYLRIK